MFQTNREGYFAECPRSVDAIYCDKTNKVSFIEIKDASLDAIRGYRSELQEKLMDSLFILQIMHPTACPRRYIIAIPDDRDRAKLVRLRRMLRSVFPHPTYEDKILIDSSLYNRHRSRKLTPEGIAIQFSYTLDRPSIKKCSDVNQMFA